jgi:integrase/recombinase XerD
MHLNDLITPYLEHLKAAGLSMHTIRTNKYDLLDLLHFLQTEKVTRVEQLTADVLNHYHQDLAFRLTAKAKPLAMTSRCRLLCTAKSFTRFLTQADYLPCDPAAALKLPRTPKTLPRNILTAAEIKRLFNACDMRSLNGFRRRVIIEVLYDTGIRRMEMAHIKIADMDLNSGYVYIRHGKGGKDRVVPVGGRVCKLLCDYIAGIRPEQVNGDDPGHLILNRFGRRMSADGIYRQVKQALAAAGIKKRISTHSLRHSCATHMLKNGAPLRHIQEMLGHASLQSTQVYTRVTINDLKQAHAKYHPGETL